ncbi:MAG: NAD(P)/FAD-dependent oxidoreductase [Deltaproteobacteria bacterium]|nr:NAD(P)/FAD-dependent oxidoreductase [Deltaproteobacteria bacterium]
MRNTKKERLVVIGNGMAGIACVEEMLKLDPHRYEVTVFGKEKHPNYNRVLLSHILTGEKALKDILLHDSSWYEKNGIKLHTGSKITAIKRKSRIVTAENGAEAQYDKLILATGSMPFIPPVSGIEKKGVVTFRDIDDCEHLKNLSKKGGNAVVIGGGLLGLEAAYGLKSLGMKVSVAHLMDRLMERQLDKVAAEFLKHDIEKLGIEILLGKETVEILGDEQVQGLRFKDGSSLDADIVVMSVGIKPNIELAMSSGVYCEKGIVVSDTMQTYDPAIYSVGECVQHRGATFGLVAPIFEQARVLANHLAGDCRLIFKNQPTSTRLKIPGIDLYSSGDINENSRTETIEYLDRGNIFYKKLLLKDNRITGILMYGDTVDGPRLFSSLQQAEDISQKRRSILFGDSMAGKAALSIETMPDDAIVCGCNGVTKGMIVEAIEKKGLFTREDVKRETKASSSCGGCGALVDQILESVLGSSFQDNRQTAAICSCTKYSRDDVIKNIREKRLKSVREVMETLGWETVGCEVCRPAINYYAAMIWPKEYEDDQTSRLVNERAHANIQKDGTFSVVPRMYGGATNPQELKRIGAVAEKYNVPLVKLTGGQRIDLIGVKKENLVGIWKELDMPSGYAYGKALRTVKTCVGSSFCRYGTQDSLNLGIEIEKKFEGLWMPAKLKMSVSGCPRNCAESAIKDIGIVGVSGGWEIYAGGCGGIELKGGEKLCFVKSTQEVMEITAAFIQYYREDAHYAERTFKWMRRVGLNTIKKVVADDTDNRKKLCLRMEDALSMIKDPWKERINASDFAYQ